MRNRFIARLSRAAVAVAALLGALACSTPDTRTPQERKADQALAQRVRAELERDPYVYAQHIDVDANRGVVRLSGKVGSDSDLRGVLRIATGVPGVQRVDDELEIIEFGFGHRR
jgi:osmotically-inducible protein OsmY